jgi:acetyltransferase-like isoleucine patch superfamily enzyme
MSVKETYWFLRLEWRYFMVWLLGRLPLRFGNWVRGRCLGSYIGGLGKGCTIQANLRIASPEKLFIGSRCNFGEDIFITAGGGVRIGDWVGIGAGAKIWSVNHKYDDPDTPWLTQGWEYKEVVIEDDVWIGANAFIMPGVHIGKGAIISACTVLSKSVPAYSIVAGNPGRAIGWRKKEEPKAQAGASPAAGSMPAAGEAPESAPADRAKTGSAETGG